MSNQLKNIDLIIFDLDGTLINSIPDLTVSLNYVASKNNKPGFSETEVKQLVGGGINNLLKKAFNLADDDIKLKEFFNLFMKHHEQNHSNYSKLYPNTKATLEYFKAKKLAVLSNKINHLTIAVAADYKIDKYFSIVLGATPELDKKPSGQPIEYILNKLNVNKKNAVMVGDSEPDIISGKNAGIYTIAVSGGYRSSSKLEAQHPDFIVDDIFEITKIINL